MEQRGHEGRKEEREAERNRAASSFFRYIKIYFYTILPHLSYVAGSFFYSREYHRALIIARPTFDLRACFLRHRQRPIWRSNVAVFAVIRIILATCKSERKTLLCSPFWIDSYINTVPLSSADGGSSGYRHYRDVKHLLWGRLSGTLKPRANSAIPAANACPRWKLP